MLKITKGLISTGIMTYTDDDGHRYVRVKIDDEDFCIAAHDYANIFFNWNEAMRLMKEEGMTMFTKKQAKLYKAHHSEINSKLKEIDGEALKVDYYWTATEHGVNEAWVYYGSDGILNVCNKSGKFRVRVRPVINM